MTLVAYLRLGKGSGMALADGEVTIGGAHAPRTYLMRGRKLRRAGTSNSFMGIAGDADFGRYIMNEMHERVKRDGLEYESVHVLAEVLQGIYADARRGVIRQALLDPVGATWEEYRSGTLNEKIMATIFANAMSSSVMPVHLLFGGAQKRKGDAPVDDEFYLLKITPPGVVTHPRGFDIIGNGNDIAEPVVADYMERASVSLAIPLHEAARTLVAAKRAAEKRNPGVGRYSRLAWVSNGHYREIERETTSILESALECYDHNLLSDDDVDGLFTIATTGRPESAQRRMMEYVSLRVDPAKLIELFFTKTVSGGKKKP